MGEGKQDALRVNVDGQKCADTGHNEEKTWSDRPSQGIIEPMDRTGARNTIYLGNVG